MKKLTALILALVMILSLAACGGSGNDSTKDSSGSGSGSPSTSGNSDNSASSGGKAGGIVLWTLAKDLEQFAERYEAETGNHVEVVVFDSADFKAKIMQTLSGKSKDVDMFAGEPQMLPDFFEAGFSSDLSALDSEVKNRLVDYTYQAGCDEDGVLRAISYQACPDSVIYRLDYFDCAVDLYQNNYVAFATEWSAPWYASMAGPLPQLADGDDVWGMDKDALMSEGEAGGDNITQVFSYVMPPGAL